MHENTPISEFFEKYLAAIRLDGHRKTSIGDKKQHCRKIATFAQERGDKTYSVALGNAFLQQFFSEQDKDFSFDAPFPLRVQIVVRTVNTLNDFFLGLPFQRVYHRSKHTLLNTQHTEMIEKFSNIMTGKGYASSSITEFRRAAVRFLEFFIINDVKMESLGLRDIERLIASFYEFHPQTIKGYITALKHILRFLHEQEIVTDDLSGKLPHAKVYRKSNIPSVWPKDDLTRIINAIDTNGAAGKRDKVILLLASRLGLRGCDIRTLKISDIDWDFDEIRIIQSKTQAPVILPLLSEIGEAIVEYLRYGRPPCNRQELILRHNAPFEPFESNTSFNGIIARYAQKADVTLPQNRKHGIHSLRHTFASALLEQKVTPSIISGLLGHTSSESVSVYLKTQDELLRECALNINEVIAHG